MSLFTRALNNEFKTVDVSRFLAKREYQPEQQSPLQTKILKPGVSRTMRAIEESEFECHEDTGSFSIEL